MSNRTTIYLVRHGAVHNPAAVFYGRLPGFSLSDEGRRHARHAAQILAVEPLAAAFSSPLERTWETAGIIVQEHDGLAVEPCDLLLEVGTRFDGRPLRELEEMGWDLYAGAGPDYEQPPVILGRMQRFMAQVRGQFAGRQVLAVTHGDPIAFFVLWARGLPLTIANRTGLYENWVTHGAVTRVVYNTGDAAEVPGVERLGRQGR